MTTKPKVKPTAADIAAATDQITGKPPAQVPNHRPRTDRAVRWLRSMALDVAWFTAPVLLFWALAGRATVPLWGHPTPPAVLLCLYLGAGTAVVNRIRGWSLRRKAAR